MLVQLIGKYNNKKVLKLNLATINIINLIGHKIVWKKIKILTITIVELIKLNKRLICA